VRYVIYIYIYIYIYVVSRLRVNVQLAIKKFKRDLLFGRHCQFYIEVFLSCSLKYDFMKNLNMSLL
jgi:hypothetical protein